MKKTRALVACVLLIAASLGGLMILPRNVEALTLYVGGTGPDNYTAIQTAIDDAEPGQTIYVYGGIYNEHVAVSKALSLIGEHRDTTIIDGNLTGSVVNASAKWVNITGFTVTRSGTGPGDAGIVVDHANNCHIADNNISGNSLGVYLENSSHSVVGYNRISLNSKNGVHVYGSSEVTIAENNISSNVDDGIWFRYSSNATAYSNSLFLNGEDGIDVRFSENITVAENDISSNFRNGTDLYSIKNITISGNHIWNNTEGVHIYFSTGSTIANNTVVSNNGDAISIWDSNVNVIARNRIEQNLVFGILLTDSNKNTIVSNRVSKNRVPGIYLGVSHGNTIDGNNLSDNEFGMYLWESKNNVVANNVATSNEWRGIELEGNSNNNLIKNNMAISNKVGIDVTNSRNNTLKDNIAFQNEYYGILVSRSSDIVMANNTASANGIDGFHLSLLTNCTIDSNSAMFNSHSGIFLDHSNASTLRDNIAHSNNDSGILLKLSANLALAGNSLYVNPYGIILDRTNDSAVAYNNVTNNEKGIYSIYADNNSIVQNNLTLNQWAGIFSDHSTRIKMEANNASSNVWYGIWLQFSNENHIEDCDISNNYDGIRLFDSSNNTLYRNRVLYNDGVGLGLELSSGNVLTNNTVQYGSMGVYANHSSDFNYFQGNLFSYHRDGVVLDYLSNNNTVVGNTVSSNYDNGLALLSCLDTHVYWNNFIGNSVQAYDDRDDNMWDNGYPSGGNYWSDYAGSDIFHGVDQDQPGSDGIGDDPYIIDPDSRDRYPLMNPSELPFPLPPKLLKATLSGNSLENVTLVWSLSPDDGTGLMSVVGYEIYRNVSYDADGLDYGLVASLPNGTSTFTDDLVGEGDPSGYFYRVCAVDILGNHTCTPNQAGKFTRPLSLGPDLISIPLLQSNASVETVLRTAIYDKAWYYDSSSQEWKWFMKSKGYRRGLWNMDHTMGIWVNVTQDSNLTVAGIVPAQTAIDMRAGWNLVSFPSFNSSYTVADLKAETGATRVEGFDTAPPYFLRVIGSGEALLAGIGYWVKAQADTVWTVETS